MTGLYAALREKCCFYLGHSGVIKDSISKLKKRLDKRQTVKHIRDGLRADLVDLLA